MMTTPCMPEKKNNATTGLSATGNQQSHGTKGSRKNQNRGDDQKYSLGDWAAPLAVIEKANAQILATHSTGSVAYNPDTKSVASEWFRGEGLSFEQVDGHIMPFLDHMSKKRSRSYLLTCAALSRKPTAAKGVGKRPSALLKLQTALAAEPALKRELLPAKSSSTNSNPKPTDDTKRTFIPSTSAADIRRQADSLRKEFSEVDFCSALFCAVEEHDVEMVKMLIEIERVRSEPSDSIGEICVVRNWALGRYTYSRDMLADIRSTYNMGPKFCSDDCIRNIDLSPLTPFGLIDALAEANNALTHALVGNGVSGPDGTTPQSINKAVNQREKLRWRPNIRSRPQYVASVNSWPITCYYTTSANVTVPATSVYLNVTTFVDPMQIDAHSFSGAASGTMVWFVLRDPTYAPNMVGASSVRIDPDRMHILEQGVLLNNYINQPFTPDVVRVPAGWVGSFVVAPTTGLVPASGQMCLTGTLHVSDVPTATVQGGWVKDLTQEGVEPNPGPGWIKDLTTEGIEPNPGPVEGELGAAAESPEQLMKETLKEMGADGTRQQNEMIAMTETAPVSVTGYAKLIGELSSVTAKVLATRKGVLNNNVAGLGNLLTNYAQTKRPFTTIQGSTNELSYLTVPENWGCTVGAFSSPANQYTFERACCSVDPSANDCTRVQFTKVGSALLVAARAGDAITASQILRINTLTTNGDSYLRALCASANKYEGGASGSFASIYLRLLGMHYGRTPLLGPEISSYLRSTNIQLNNPAAYTDNTGDTWPLSSFHTNNANPVVMARACTYQDFCSVRYGGTAFDAAYSPTTWGTTCAVVFLQTDMLGRAGAVAAWTLAHMEYPYKGIFFSARLLDDAGNDLGVAGGTPNPGISPAASYTRIRGPTANVLYVITNLNSLATGSNTIIQVSNIGVVNVDTTLNSAYAGGVDINIGVALSQFHAQTNGIVERDVSGAMEFWQRTIGSEEDMRTALMMAADAFHRIAPNMYRTFGAVEGSVQSFGVSAVPNAPNINTLFTDQVAIDMADATTTPSGAKCFHNLADIQSGWANTLRIGALDVECEGDLIAGIIAVQNSCPLKFPQTSPQTTGLIRALVGKVTTFAELTLRSIGYSPYDLWLDRAGESQMVWDQYYCSYNAWLDTVCLKFNGRCNGSANMQGAAPNWYFNYVPSCQRAGWGRVPLYTCKLNGATSLEIPQKSIIGPFTEKTIGQDWPLAGDIFELITEVTPEPGDEAYTRFASLASMAMFIDRISGPVPLNIYVATSTESGSQMSYAAFPVTQPNSRGVLYPLSLYGGEQPGTAAQVDAPIHAPPNVRNGTLRFNTHVAFVGNWVANFTRGHAQYMPQPRLVRLSGTPDAMILRDAGGGNVGLARLAGINKSFRSDSPPADGSARPSAV